MNNIKTVGLGFLGATIALFSYGAFEKHTESDVDVLSDISSPSTQLVNNSQVDEPFSQLPSLTDAASASIDAVVHIKVLTVHERYRTYYDPFRKLLGKNPYYKKKLNEKVKMGAGSGVIVSENGYIVTNNHVIAGASKIEVKLNDNRVYEGTIIGTDPNTDMAVLKINETGLKHLTFGNSDEIQIGEWALAVGNPFNLTSTVTAGIISAKGRSISGKRKPFAVESFIQTDAAINPGNSGGALVNAKGELIGINTAITSHSGTYEGYAFAIPSNMAQKIAFDIIKYGSTQRVMLGVQIRTMDEQVADQHGVEFHNGVMIERLQKDGNAALGGMKVGDIVTQIDSKQIKKVTEIQESIMAYDPNDTIHVEIIRDNEPMTLSIKLSGDVLTSQ